MEKGCAVRVIDKRDNAVVFNGILESIDAERNTATVRGRYNAAAFSSDMGNEETTLCVPLARVVESPIGSLSE